MNQRERAARVHELDGLVSQHIFQGADRVEGGGIGGPSIFWVPAYSSDMADCWRVVEKMREREFRFSLHEVKTWRAAFCRRSILRPMPVIAEHESPALAICLAALRSLGVQVAE